MHNRSQFLFFLNRCNAKKNSIRQVSSIYLQVVLFVFLTHLLTP